MPSNLSHFVFCQYSFFNIGEMLVVAPNFNEIDDETKNKSKIKPLNSKFSLNLEHTTFKFDHQKVNLFFI